MSIRGFSGIRRLFLLFFAVPMSVSAQASLSEAEIWQKAVELRAESFTMAPGGLPYEQYHINKEGQMGGRETGRMLLLYDETGKASISIDWARRGERDFTEERAKRMEKQSSRFTEYLSFTTPFDPDVQDKLERNSGTRVYIGGKALWHYEFRLPMDRRRSFVGSALVGDDGRPYEFRYTLAPLPWFLDIMDIHIVFDAAEEYLLFGRLNYLYEASFLFWHWKGGGYAVFDDWKRISVPPRLN